MQKQVRKQEKPEEMYNILMIYKFQKTIIIDIVGPWETLCRDVFSPPRTH